MCVPWLGMRGRINGGRIEELKNGIRTHAHRLVLASGLRHRIFHRRAAMALRTAKSECKASLCVLSSTHVNLYLLSLPYIMISLYPYTLIPLYLYTSIPLYLYTFIPIHLYTYPPIHPNPHHLLKHIPHPHKP